MDQESSLSVRMRRGRSEGKEEEEDRNHPVLDLQLSLSIGGSSSSSTSNLSSPLTPHLVVNPLRLPSQQQHHDDPFLHPPPPPISPSLQQQQPQQREEGIQVTPLMDTLFSHLTQQKQEEAMVGSSFLDGSTVRRQQQQQQVQHEAIEIPAVPFFNSIRSQRLQEEEAMVGSSFLDSSTVRRQQQQHEAIEIPAVPFFNSVRSQRPQEEEAIGRARGGRGRRQRKEQQAIGVVLSGLNIGRQQQQQPQQQQPIAVPPVLNRVVRQQQRHAHAPQRTRTRRNRSASNAKADIEPPYPWATNRPAGVHSLEYLISNNITRITHEVICRRCNAQFTYEFNLEEKFRELSQFIYNNRHNFLHRAPRCWTSPELPTCTHCEQPNSLKPLMPESRNEPEKVNWLFLLLGQLLGLCTLEQLKFCCQHTKNHRTGAKDRVLFLTYLGLCKQVDPLGPYDLF